MEALPGEEVPVLLESALHEGSFHDGRVTCPRHGSTFRLRDGAVVRAPAAASQPVFETRVSNGKLEVRAAR
jgi:nitrite reductase/ring-hydroxylating ferredoxin subunit